MEENKTQQQPEVIDLRQVFRKIWASRRLFYKTLPTAFVLACIYILGVPRTYTSEVKLAPEMENSGAGGALSSLASSFGFDLGDMQTTDAITPLLYPDLMEDNGFVTSMFGINVKTLDGDVSTTYHDYLQKYTQPSVWSKPMIWVKQLLKPSGKGGDSKFDPYQLSRLENEVAEAIRGNVKISVDKKNGVITINVQAQDPLVCKTMADSIKERLQLFITEYRTNKSRTDYEYYKKLTEQAKHEYEKTRQMYGSMADANSRIALKSVELKMEDMENDMQLKFNTYTSMNTQLQAAKAKVQERTPVFTVIKGAAVPVKPSGPKRMIFVLAITIVTFIATSLYIVRKDLHFQF